MSAVSDAVDFLGENWLYVCLILGGVLFIWKDGLIERFRNGRDTTTVELFYHPQCSFCKQFKPIWDDFKSAVAEDGSLRVIDHNCAEVACNNVLVKGYPTILVSRDGQQIQYLGERTKEALITAIYGSMGVPPKMPKLAD
jgi:thiol-disulfide isomerase/thioredoxin